MVSFSYDQLRSKNDANYPGLSFMPYGQMIEEVVGIT